MIKSTVHSTKEDSLVSLKVHDPYYRGKPLYICIAKEWFDKVNGNSYWSARVEDIENDITYVFPWQYGYGDSSLHEVMRALNLSHYEHEKVKYIKIEKCLKKEIVEHGTGDKDNWISEKGYYYQD
jgi:hypothetical protein